MKNSNIIQLNTMAFIAPDEQQRCQNLQLKLYNWRIQSKNDNLCCSIMNAYEYSIIILLGAGIVGCTNPSLTTGQKVKTDSTSTLSTPGNSPVQRRQQKTSNESDSVKGAALVLSINELRYVDKTTGASRSIPFGTSENQLVELINRLLNLKQPKIGINSECGAGPLKMATWSNGLTVIFKENRETETWEFAGWSMGSGSVKAPKMTTMANIGIGSTRTEMEDAYNIKTEKTSLGYEFSTSGGGLHGIFSGPGKDATITNLWSGTSCVFR